MAKFMLLYKGAATDVSQMPEQQQKAIMDKWQSWMKQVGKQLVDVGSPFGQGGSVVDDGSEGKPVPMSGYSIVEAADLDKAKQLCDGHPYLSEGKGDFAIEVFELLPAPF